MGRLSKDKRDAYYREAKKEGYRARSAFKLLQIDHTLDLLSGVHNVADLCAAPGGWSQVLAKRLYRPAEGLTGRIVAVDRYEMQPIEGVVQVTGDITHASTAQDIIKKFDGEYADLVVCDGAPDMTFRVDFDEHVQHQLVLSQLHLATVLLRPGGAFVSKIFRGAGVCQVYAMLQRWFGDVVCCKPKASRHASHEVFVVCRDFAPPPEFDRNTALYSTERHEKLADVGSDMPGNAVRFIACGAENEPDSTRSYPVDKNHTVLDPVAPPIAAPYKEAIRTKRGQEVSLAAVSKSAKEVCHIAELSRC